MNQLTKSEYLVNFLTSNGTTHIFGYPGGYITRFTDALYQNKKIKTHLCYHEQACAFATCAYARLTGNVGVYFTTSGPGVINGLAGLADAYFDGVPLLAIGGNVNTFEMKGNRPIRQLGFQEMDAVSVCKPVTKKAVSATSADNFAELLEDLWQTALSDRCGPVFLDFPFDVQKEIIDFVPRGNSPDKSTEKYQDEKILNLIKSAKRPIVIAGSGVRTAGAVAEIRKIAAKIPTVTSMNAVDLIADKRHKIGFIGAYGSRLANTLLSQSDVVISVGARLDTRQTGMMPKDATLIRVDIDGGELSLEKPNQTSVQADAKLFLNFLLESDVESDFSDVRKLQEKFSGFDRELGNLFMEEIGKYILPNSVITTDVGQNQVWTAQSLHPTGDDSRILIGGGYGSMGCSLPYAIAGGLVSGSPVYCIAGDGGVQMNIQELQTVVREGLAVKIFVFNNSSLGMIRVFQTELFEERFAYTVNSGGYIEPDFCAVARGYGIKSARITVPADFAKYAEWFRDGDACLFDVALGEGTSLMPKILFGKHGYA
ncbi:MAG: thiamine pyrophosphate-binding protein [Ruminococcus sp.]|jgi:acetolactate synthase-1/2/3 large subunit|nr:thiamine pyrophosphate-binding protein [Ruminococcus sp.]